MTSFDDDDDGDGDGDIASREQTAELDYAESAAAAARDTRTLDDVLGYTFTCRRETPGEYRERTGAATTMNLVFPAMIAKITSLRGQGDWRPSVSSLGVRELLD